MKNKIALIGLLSIGLDMFCLNPQKLLPPKGNSSNSQSGSSNSNKDKLIKKIKEISLSMQSGGKKAVNEMHKLCSKIKDKSLVIAGTAKKAGRAVGSKVSKVASVVGSNTRKVVGVTRKVVGAVGSGIDTTTEAIKHGCGKILDATTYTYNQLPSLKTAGFVVGACGAAYWFKNGTDSLLKSKGLRKIILAAWMLKLLHSLVIKTVDSEKYYFANGVKGVLTAHINKFLPSVGAPAKSDSDIQKWVEDVKMSESLRKEITPRMKKNGYNINNDEERTLIVDQLNKDIRQISNKALCPTLLESIKNLFYNKEKNYEIKHAFNFANSNIVGKAWSRHNLFDLRHGSSAYVEKLIQLLVLRDILTR